MYCDCIRIILFTLVCAATAKPGKRCRQARGPGLKAAPKAHARKNDPMQKHPMPVRRWLSACGGGGASEEHDHENVSIDTAGRLAIAEHNAAVMRVHDPDSLTGAVTARRNVGYTPSALAWLGITR